MPQRQPAGARAAIGDVSCSLSMLRSRGETRFVARQTILKSLRGTLWEGEDGFIPQRVDLLSGLSVLWGSGAFLWRLLPGNAEQKP